MLWRESLVPAVYPKGGCYRPLTSDCYVRAAVAARRDADLQRARSRTHSRRPGRCPPHSGTVPGLSATCSTVRPAAAAARARSRATRAALVSPAQAHLGGLWRARSWADLHTVMCATI